MRMRSLLAVNLLLAIVWGAMQGTRTAFGYTIGFGFGFLILTLGQPDYGRRTLAAVAYAGFLLWQIVLSSYQVVKTILTPGDASDPGIVAIPLQASSAAEVLLLASSITLTPGTISVETGTGPGGERVLFVHALSAGDPDDLRRQIRDEFEARILRFTRPAPKAG